MQKCHTPGKAEKYYICQKKIMRHIIKSIPNLLTLSNLFCGCVAVTYAFSGDFITAFWLVVLAAVFDFLDFHWGESHWPAFNIADSFICLGAGLLVLQGLLSVFQARKGKVNE